MKNKHKIEDFKSGKLIKKDDFYYFLPEKINKQWVWEDPEIDILLQDANLAIGSLESYSDLIPNIDIYIKMHVLAEAHSSNKIEGTKTTIEEDLMDLEDLSPEKRDDAIEVHNYIKALNYGIERIVNDNFPFSVRLLKEIHEILLSGVRGTHKTPGEFRHSQNWIGGSRPGNATFVPPSNEHVVDFMSDLEKFIHNENLQIPHLIKLAIFHYQFETIHPFLDGNGRLGRLIIPLYLLNYGLLKKPSFYVSNYLEKNRTEYYDSLTNVREKNQLSAWIKYFLKAMCVTALDVKTKFSNVINLVEKYNSISMSIKGRPENINNILQAFYQEPILSINDLMNMTDLSRNAVSSIVRDLEDKEILFEVTGATRYKLYVLKEYFLIFSDN